MRMRSRALAAVALGLAISSPIPAVAQAAPPPPITVWGRYQDVFTVPIPVGATGVAIDVLYSNYDTNAFMVCQCTPGAATPTTLGSGCGVNCTQHWAFNFLAGGPQVFTYWTTSQYSFGGFWSGTITWVGETTTETKFTKSLDIVVTVPTPTPTLVPMVTPRPYTSTQYAPMSCKLVMLVDILDHWSFIPGLWLGADVTVRGSSACPVWMKGTDQELVSAVMFPPGYGDLTSVPVNCLVPVCTDNLHTHTDVAGPHEFNLTGYFLAPPGWQFPQHTVTPGCYLNGRGDGMVCALHGAQEIP